jgi:demethylmacrocin O-methyltransferase
LALIYGTDKGPQFHGYTEHYRRLFGPIRRRRLTLLEIGIEDGASLRLWRRFFPKARIIGIDLEPPAEIRGVEMYAGDQSDPEFLAELVARCGPFDIVIDDGSHFGRHIRASFEALFPAVKSDGWYVIEDLGGAYFTEAEGGPPGTPGTAIELLRSLLDRTQHYSGRHGGHHDCAEIRLLNEIAFIRRA